MKNLFGVILVLSLFGLFAPTASAAASSSAVSGGARFHRIHTEFEDFPVGDGDYSYGGALEYHEKQAYWQFALMYANKPGTNNVDWLATPQVNLIFKDRFWRGGVGALTGYVEKEEGGEWLDVFWQIILGFNLPMGGLEFQGMAYYVFESWSEIDEFSFDELEYGFWLSYSF